MNRKKVLELTCLMRLHKPIGIFLILWPTLMALWLASRGSPDPKLVGIFIAGVIVMRSLGCVINDLADRKFDKFVTRTENRPLTTGVVSAKEAVFLILGLLILAFLLVLQLNVFTIQLSMLALLLSAFYPLLKRYTHFPQVALGAAFGMAVLMAFSASTGSIPIPALWLYLAVFFWTVAYDTEYAMVDREDDLKIGLKSTAIIFGKYDRLIVFALQCLMLLLFTKVGLSFGLGKMYYFGVLGAAIFVLYQQFLLKDKIPKNCFDAFLNNHYLGAWIFSFLMLDYSFKQV